MIRPFDRGKVLKRIQSICRKAVKSHGYTGKGRTWKLVTERFVRLIDLQTSKYVLHSELRFTFNLGVFFPEVFLAQHDQLPEPPIEEWHCCPSVRVGELFFGGDKWWTVTRDTAESELTTELTTLLVDKVVPWLSRFDTLEDVMNNRLKQQKFFDVAITAYAMRRDDVLQWVQKALDTAPHDTYRRGVEIWARDHDITGFRS